MTSWGSFPKLELHICQLLDKLWSGMTRGAVVLVPSWCSIGLRSEESAVSLSWTHSILGIFVDRRESEAHCTRTQKLIDLPPKYRCCRQPRYTNRLSRLSNVCHVCSMWGKKQWQLCLCHFWCFLANASQATWCWAVRTGSTSGHWDLIPPSWSVFLTSLAHLPDHLEGFLAVFLLPAVHKSTYVSY